MGKYVVQGGNVLSGEVAVQGAKNSVLPILAATVMARGESIVHNCPKIRDVEITIEILKHLGCAIKRENNTIIINAENVNNYFIPDHLMGKMRSSVIFMGAILSRTGIAKCSYPGGCELGARPIDLHLKSFKNLGAVVEEENGFIICRLEKFAPGKINLDFPSVGATENIMLIASKSKGTTTIINAAREPEIVDLQNFLNSMGAKIKGAGSSIIEIDGVDELKPVERSVISDRIVAATLMCAVVAARGDVLLKDTNVSHIDSIISVLGECGARITTQENGLRIACKSRLSATDVQTMPYPGFPTDAQSQFMAALCTMKGTGVIKETIFENRFNTATELKKMGANIKVHDRVAIVRGVPKLSSAALKAPDLRGGASLVIAALGADGISEIENIHYIDRGYENLEGVFQSLGGNIKRI